MSYVNTPRSWTTGELVTASYMNGLRDALNELSRAVLTTTGDLLYASSSTVSARLAIGSNGYPLVVASGLPAWATSSTVMGPLAGISLGTTPAASGEVRIPNGGTVKGRNNANSGDVTVASVGTDDTVTFGSTNGARFNTIYPVASANFIVDWGGSNGNTWQLRKGGLPKATFGNGLILQDGTGADPTGGDKGSGTINVATDIYKNNTAYTNPDYAFEHAFTGRIERFKDRQGAASYPGLRPLAEVEAFARRHFRLPNLARFGDEDGGVGIFARADLVLELIEELHLRLFEVNRQIKALGAVGV